MEESEKMKGLKKAYAEIILNTAKEAAVRVMTSDRKAHELQYNLSSTKDEALCLLLRLKSTMDAKINEVEMKSLNQQRKIEELEAQLQEAEDIVSNLREELDEAHMKLKDIKRKQLNNASKITEDVHREEINQQTVNGMPEAVLAAQSKSSALTNGHYLANDSVDVFGFSGDPIVPSILRSRKTECYRNGCTQRIRAYEGNLFNDRFSLSEGLSDLKYKKCISEGKEVEGIYATSIGAESTYFAGRKSFEAQEVEDVDTNNSKPQALKSFVKLRKSAARNRSDASIFKSVPYLSNQEFSDLPASQTCLPGSQYMPENSEFMINGIPSPSVAPCNLPEMGVSSGCLRIVQGNNLLACINTGVANSLVMIEEKTASEDCLDVPCSKIDMEMKNSGLLNSDCKFLEVGNVLLSPPLKHRVLKYTYQRKRKKESFSDGDSRLYEDPLKRKMEKQENENVESSNSSTVAESSQDRGWHRVCNSSYIPCVQLSTCLERSGRSG